MNKLTDARGATVRADDRVQFWFQNMLQTGTVSSVQGRSLRISWKHAKSGEWRVTKRKADECWKTGERQGSLDL